MDWPVVVSCLTGSAIGAFLGSFIAQLWWNARLVKAK